MTISVDTPARPRRRRVRVVDEVLYTCAATIAVFADVLAFNQVATQSPTDGILQLVVVGVGLAGGIEAIRRLALASDRTDRLLGLPLAALSILAVIGWRAGWPVGGAVIVSAATAVVVGVIGARASLALRAEDDGPSGRPEPGSSQFAVILTIAQAMVLAWFAILTAASARGVLFG